LYHGVPMIGFPLFAEQHDNCIRAANKGYGVCMNILEFTSDELVDNIHDVLYRGDYRKTIKLQSEIWKDDLTTPRQRAIYWIEHVTKFGGSHLRSPAMDMPLYQFLMLDIIAILGTVIILSFLFTFYLLRCVYRKCKHVKRVDSEKKKKQ